MASQLQANMPRTSLEHTWPAWAGHQEGKPCWQEIKHTSKVFVSCQEDEEEARYLSSLWPVSLSPICTAQCLSTLLMLWPFNTVLMLWWPPNKKVVFVITSKLYFATVNCKYLCFSMVLGDTQAENWWSIWDLKVSLETTWAPHLTKARRLHLSPTESI